MLGKKYESGNLILGSYFSADYKSSWPPKIIITLEYFIKVSVKYIYKLTLLTLGLSPHHTHRHGVRGGGVRVLSQQEIIPVLSVVFLTDFPRPGLLPASEHEAVPVNVLPVSRALAERTETGEVHGVGVGHGQPQQGQHVESPHVARASVGE